MGVVHCSDVSMLSRGFLTQDPNPVPERPRKSPLAKWKLKEEKEITRSLGSRKEVWPGNPSAKPLR